MRGCKNQLGHRAGSGRQAEGKVGAEKVKVEEQEEDVKTMMTTTTTTTTTTRRACCRPGGGEEVDVIMIEQQHSKANSSNGSNKVQEVKCGVEPGEDKALYVGRAPGSCWLRASCWRSRRGGPLFDATWRYPQSSIASV